MSELFFRVRGGETFPAMTPEPQSKDTARWWGMKQGARALSTQGDVVSVW
ncbi:hypothetical protein [Roseomonas genomospecies 6]|nr:hypothetical protein [Roseomonas genomospecies 6]